MSQSETEEPITRLALLGNHLPRQCGIATFTTDLAQALADSFPHVGCGVVAMNDAGKTHAYGSPVQFEVDDGDLASYRRATDFLNVGGLDVLSLQHEYGIFGGKQGSHILTLLAGLRMPVVTTLHTILSEPSAAQRRVMGEVTRLSSRLVVMSHHGARLLRTVYDVPAEKIDFIPHGIPTLPSRAASRRRLGVEDTIQLLTFGLLSPDKGLEYVIEALPQVVARHPSVTYVIVGATHPHVKEEQGEAYRRSLQQRAHKLGVGKHVVFHDRFVSADELGEFLAAADIYLTPYLNPEQITSGTLAYAVGNGKAVISTRYRYASELLADERGVLVPWRDAQAVASALLRLLDEPEQLAEYGRRAADFGRDMTWASVAQQYMATFQRAHRDFGSKRRAFLPERRLSEPPVELPELDLRHLGALTDDTGILQHALFCVPRYADGYCIDDNARGLLLTAWLSDTGTSQRRTIHGLSSRYLAFLSYAFNAESERFRNFMDYARRWTETRGSEDSQGRTLWALGAVVGRMQEHGRKTLATELFRAALPSVRELQSHRSWAFALLGIHEYSRAFQSDEEVQALQRKLAGQLFAKFRDNQSDQWRWCEDILTYDNARLSQALIVSGRDLGDQAMVSLGIESLEWLCSVQRCPEGYFRPVGSNGFYPRQGQQAAFDQQPIDACASVSACLDAWRVTKEKSWIVEMRRAFSWFLGENELRLSLYDPTTGGCRDGLHPDRCNENQGAESTLSFLLALTEMTMLDSELRLSAETAPISGTSP